MLNHGGVCSKAYLRRNEQLEFNLYTCMYVVTCALYSNRGLHSITNNNNNNNNKRE